MDERESKLPRWAQDELKDLRRRVAAVADQSAAELATLRPKVELLERRLGAMEELVTCAAKGGHRTAAEIVAVLESYSLTVTKEE